MSCHCVENRQQLALLVGRDAVGDLPEHLRRSVSSCPQCREYFRGLCQSMAAINHVHEEEVPHLRCSLWNSLSKRLPEKRVRSNAMQDLKRQLVPVFSMTAACLVLAVVFLDSRPTGNRIYQTTSARGTQGMTLPLMPVQQSAHSGFDGGVSLIDGAMMSSPLATPSWEENSSPFNRAEELEREVFLDKMSEDLLRFREHYKSLRP
ncbi:hypothetical protein [Rubinisphaera margarita]|uniref:hypothetical protein n=1 Tax=Rubinisphaera margarita TaxID=2909586 RepID=UPI001EE7CBB3|nr:hypothetical protein [Rubinisphaera margarita]MCG6156099.1 hypothetical protein [Rubinisphaera margarita]